MKKNMYTIILLGLITSTVGLGSCKKYEDGSSRLKTVKKRLYGNWLIREDNEDGETYKIFYNFQKDHLLIKTFEWYEDGVIDDRDYETGFWELSADKDYLIIKNDEDIPQNTYRIKKLTKDEAVMNFGLYEEDRIWTKVEDEE